MSEDNAAKLESRVAEQQESLRSLRDNHSTLSAETQSQGVVRPRVLVSSCPRVSSCRRDAVAGRGPCSGPNFKDTLGLWACAGPRSLTTAHSYRGGKSTLRAACGLIYRAGGKGTEISRSLNDAPSQAVRRLELERASGNACKACRATAGSRALPPRSRSRSPPPLPSPPSFHKPMRRKRKRCPPQTLSVVVF